MPDPQSLLQNIAEALCEKPEAINIVQTKDDNGVTLLLYVDPQDLGRMIGKAGANASAIRTLLRAMQKDSSRISFKVDKQ